MHLSEFGKKLIVDKLKGTSFTVFGSNTFNEVQFELLWNKDNFSKDKLSSLSCVLIALAKTEEELMFLKHWYEGA